MCLVFFTIVIAFVKQIHLLILFLGLILLSEYSIFLSAVKWALKSPYASINSRLINY